MNLKFCDKENNCYIANVTLKIIVMKKILIFCVMAICAISSVSAQMAFGVKAGVNFSSLSWSNEEIASDDSGVGFGVGAMMEYMHKKTDIGFDISLLVSMENYKFMFHSMSGDSYLDYGSYFIKFPIHFKWMPKFINGGKVIRPILYTGPEFGFFLPFRTVENLDKAKFEKKSPIKWNFGVGAEIVNKLQVTVQYGLGLNDMFEYEYRMINETIISNGKHNTLMVSVAWMFR